MKMKLHFKDVDECLNGQGKNLCTTSQPDCINTPGAYICTCLTGFDNSTQICHGKNTSSFFEIVLLFCNFLL